MLLDVQRDGYMMIKEFSKFSGLTEAALRHYDKSGVFFPAMKGVDMENNYRLYSPLQVTTVKMIRFFKETGAPLPLIKELARDRTPEIIVKLLNAYMQKIKDKINILEDVYSAAAVYSDLLNISISASENDITVDHMDEMPIILGDRNDFRDTVGFLREFLRFCYAPHEPKLNLSYPIGGFFENMDAFTSASSQPTRFFSIDPKGKEKKEAGLYLIGYTRGYYGRANDLPERLVSYADKNGLEFAGPLYGIYAADEISVVDPDRYLLQASIRIKETRCVTGRQKCGRRL